MPPEIVNSGRRSAYLGPMSPALPPSPGGLCGGLWDFSGTQTNMISFTSQVLVLFH